VNSSPDGYVVTVLSAPGVPSALVYLAGEIDLAAAGALSDAMDRLSALAPANVMVDLADVTFACASLPNFLVGLRDSLPSDSALWACRPSPASSRILRTTGMDLVVTIRIDFPVVRDDAEPGERARRRN
jgi:anti-anti-sigma regulatory factor